MRTRQTLFKYRVQHPMAKRPVIAISKERDRRRKPGVKAEVPGDPYTKTISVTLNREMTDRLDNMADEAGISRSALIRRLILQATEKNEASPDDSTRGLQTD